MLHHDDLATSGFFKCPSSTGDSYEQPSLRTTDGIAEGETWLAGNWVGLERAIAVENYVN